jgi:small GTP-binding protein
VVGYECVNNIHQFNVSEMIEGRDIVDFDVVELPRVNYTSNNWINKEDVRMHIESADVILYILTCDDVAINSRKTYLEELLNNLQLKKGAVFLIGYGMADWVLYPECARNFVLTEKQEVAPSAVTEMLKKVNMVYTEFSSFDRFDATFGISSIVPYSNAVSWNITELKKQIWNGLVQSMNEILFDESIPTIVLSGKTGCGKTSTINALWNKDLATNRIASCTKYPAVMRIKDVYNGQTVEFNLVDLPGISESLEANSMYQGFYSRFINKASLVICLTQADRRAYKQDQLFYTNLMHNNILRKNQQVVLGINQADLLFKSSENLDGIDLHTIADDDAIIVDKVNDFYNNVFADIFHDFENVNKDSVVIYSVFQKWHLDNLKNKLYNLIF